MVKRRCGFRFEVRVFFVFFDFFFVGRGWFGKVFEYGRVFFYEGDEFFEKWLIEGKIKLCIVREGDFYVLS